MGINQFNFTEFHEHYTKAMKQISWLEEKYQTEYDRMLDYGKKQPDPVRLQNWGNHLADFRSALDALIVGIHKMRLIYDARLTRQQTEPVSGGNELPSKYASFSEWAKFDPEGYRAYNIAQAKTKWDL